jgi:hypothetical protein
MEDSNVNIKKEQKCYWEIDIIAQYLALSLNTRGLYP